MSSPPPPSIPALTHLRSYYRVSIINEVDAPMPLFCSIPSEKYCGISPSKNMGLTWAAPSSETKDKPEDKGSSGIQLLKPHKSSRKVQLKEVHHSNETASVKVMTPDGITLAAAKGPQKRRPAPPPPPKQPPRRPPPPPPPVTPPPSQVMVLVDEAEAGKDKKEHKVEVQDPSHLAPYSSKSPDEANGPSSPDLPLPPPPTQGNEMSLSDEPLPPPPDPKDVDAQSRENASLIYPKNSYMSYRSEKKFGRQGFDGKYHRSFHSSVSSMDLTSCDSSLQDGKQVSSPNSWEQVHNVRQHGTTVVFHSDVLQGNHIQRSSSQDLDPVEETAIVADNISHVGTQNPQCNQSSDSISPQYSEVEDQPQKSVPYQPPSHEKVSNDLQNSSRNSQNQNLLLTKGFSLKSKSPADVIINCETADIPLDNETTMDGKRTINENDSNVDLNQNSLKSRRDKSASKILNGNDSVNRINCATQTTETSTRMLRKCWKSREELECEQLSREFVHHYGDNALKNLLVPASNHKTMTDYLEGLLNLDFEKDGHQDLPTTIIASKNQSAQSDENCSNNETSNAPPEAKLDSIVSNGTDRDNQNVNNDVELKKKKEELILSIGKKVESFKGKQTNIRAEINQNELLGQKIANKLKEIAKPNEIEKYSLHVEEMEKIVNLLLSLSGRLARAENLLKNLPKDFNKEERKALEAKRDKLKDQHEDACRLKESIDRRSNQVSTFLHKYLSDVEYTDYDHFINMKTKLIVDIRDTDEKINLAVEQLAALSVVAHLWKSANS
ncbi:hypothetical protein JTE90_028253 [Oedothorax gibbosus]|uniref:ASD2 domain-containing protein n=1 Tax=Oedothorax gibbosus TaxID=931172 RepID=A0AAV6URL6_9ARAC|nr:hypothetical protein JTE90_028253 [Oedothorax gibbosus]